MYSTFTSKTRSGSGICKAALPGNGVTPVKQPRQKTTPVETPKTPATEGSPGLDGPETTHVNHEKPTHEEAPANAKGPAAHMEATSIVHRRKNTIAERNLILIEDGPVTHLKN